MERYVWSFDNKTLKESDVILIKKGENVRFIMENETMMNHPIHLHGHFFRVINGQGDYCPLKHTVDVRPMDTTVIEFFADQEKDWFFHCHILYHMMSGMARVVRYEGTQRDSKLIQAERKDKRFFEDWYAKGHVSAQSNMVEGFFRFADVRNQFEVHWDNNYEGEYEVEPMYLRNFTRFLDVFVGGEFKDKGKDKGNVATWGIRYVLPLYIEMEGRMDCHGDFRLQFEKEMQLTDRVELSGYYRINFEFKEPWKYSNLEIEHEYRVELEYRLTKNLSIVGNYDSEYRAGGGVKLRF